MKVPLFDMRAELAPLRTERAPAGWLEEGPFAHCLRCGARHRSTGTTVPENRIGPEGAGVAEPPAGSTVQRL